MTKLFYFRTSHWTVFLLPTLAVGIDQETGLPFFEIAWLRWAAGIGAVE